MSEDFSIYRRKLPHWRQTGTFYFVTWRLRSNQTNLNPDERTIVQNAIQQFDGQRYGLVAFVVMDDHVHVLVKPRPEYRLQDIVHSWKSFTANRLQRTQDRWGCIWQAEYFDRIVRNKNEFNEKVQYILNNPFKRWPEIQEYQWLKLNNNVEW